MRLYVIVTGRVECLAYGLDVSVGKKRANDDAGDRPVTEAAEDT